MLSRVYTPMVTPYARPQIGRNAMPPALDSDEAKSPFQTDTNPSVLADNGDLQRQSGGLKAVQTDSTKKIPLDAVLQDFQSTINALGADEQTRSEVVAYLRVVGLQGNKENPHVPFIKQTLRTAAGTLDQFIGKALGQPSQVVKEWVDALLLQDIDYHIQEPPAWLAQNTSDFAVSPVGTTQAPAELSPPVFDERVKTQVKGYIETAKTLFKQDALSDADATLQKALDTLAVHDQPLWTGKVWQVRARFQDKVGDWQQSAAAYEQAAQSFATGERSDLQAEALHSVASILDEHGEWQQAATHYQTVTELDAQRGDSEALLRSLNDLGSLYLRQGDTGNAVSTLERATRESFKTASTDTAQGDVLNNLGTAYRAQQRYDSAIQAYRQSLKLAKNDSDHARYTSTLQQLAATYVDAGQPAQAMQALQRLTELQAQV